MALFIVLGVVVLYDFFCPGIFIFYVRSRRTERERKSCSIDGCIAIKAGIVRGMLEPAPRLSLK